MMFSALVIASVAYAQTWDASRFYYSTGTSCQGAPDILTLTLQDGSSSQCDPVCKSGGLGAGLRYFGTETCNLPSISTTIGDAFGSTPYVVIESFADDQCTQVNRVDVYKATNVCLPHLRQYAFSIEGNNVIIRHYENVKNCSFPVIATETIASNLLSKTTCRPTKDFSAYLPTLNGDFHPYARIYTSNQFEPPTTSTPTSVTNPPTTSSTSVTNPTGNPSTTYPNISSAWELAASLPIALIVSIVHFF